MTPDVSVVVVNWNGASFLPACLDSLLAQRDVSFEVIVVDNGSTDDSADIVRSRYPEVRWEALGRNCGFAAGNNAGAKLGQGRYLAFLNNDAEAEPRWLVELVQVLSADEGAALAASCITRRDNPGVVDSAGDGWLRVGTAFKRGQGEPASSWGEAGEVFGACGAAFMIRREVYEALGGFDEDFFLVFEDVDLSYRVRLRGHRCVYVPTARVRHAVSASLGRASATSVFHGQRNVEWVYLKNTPTPLLLRTLPAHVLYELAGAAYFLTRRQFSAFLRGKISALAGLGAVLEKRRTVQSARVVETQALWQAMTGGWVRAKWRDKRLGERGR